MKKTVTIILPIVLLFGFVFRNNIHGPDTVSETEPLSKKSEQRVNQGNDSREAAVEVLADDDATIRIAEGQMASARIENLVDLQNALLAAEEKWGPGLELRDAIIDLFRESNVPLHELISFLEGSSDQTLVGHAFTGILQRFNDPSLGKISDAGDISALVHLNFNGKTFGDVLDAYVNAPDVTEDRVSRLKEAFDILNEANFEDFPLLVPEIFKGLAGNLSAGETPEFLDNLVASKFNFLDDPEIQKSILASLEGESSIAALQFFSDYSGIDDDAKWYLSRNAVRFSTSNLKDYLANHPGDLMAKAAYAQNLLQNGYPEMLSELIEVEGFGERPVYGKKLAGQLWTYESRIVGAEAKKNPEKVVTNMANGTSQFKNCHLVTAINEWIKTDSEAAAHWVETVGINLPPEDRQFVAISYAREAANQGDIELANRWADLILDENRKARMMQHIARKR